MMFPTVRHHNMSNDIEVTCSDEIKTFSVNHGKSVGFVLGEFVDV